MGNAFVSIVLFIWIPAVLALFSVLAARRAVVTAFLLAWLFLPMASVKIAEGIPVYDKMSATCIGVLTGAVLFDLRRLTQFRPGVVDLPMAVWCLCPMASSVTNGLGEYDGFAAMISQTVTWGLPYVIGRIYFSDREGVRELAKGLFIGGLIYVPLCLIEIRMSPQLHIWVYGYHQHSFSQTLRFGGFRPTVFMQHGLMVGMWMCMTALIGLWLWYTGAMTRVWRVPMGWAVAGLVVTAILCKSAGAVALLAAGVAALALVAGWRSRGIVWVLILAAPVYMAVRGTGMWDASELVSSAAATAGEQRSDSLAFRVRNENILAEKARQQPVFGWGGWGRARVYDKYGRDVSVTDGLWIIALGNSGVVGLASWTLAMLLPAGLVVWRFGAGRWKEAGVAPGVVLAVVVILYVVDCVPNGMVNPIFTVCAGGMGSLAMLGAGEPRAAGSAVPLALVRRRGMAAGGAG